jgi:hypothetical protein
VRSTAEVVDLQQLNLDDQNWHMRSSRRSQALCPVSAGPEGRKMKRSMLIKTVAGWPCGISDCTIAAQSAKTTTERGVIEKVSASRIQFAHNWLGS